VALPIIYVVRVYRRSRRDRRVLVGIVEVVDAGTRLSFNNAAQLWSLISAPPRVRKRSGRFGSASPTCT
jgi:hypothetical protein